MTITYPRALHSYSLAECSFLLVEAVSLSRGVGGKTVAAVEVADPYWRAIFRTPNLAHTDKLGWAAWKNSLRGGLKTFLAFDWSRREPKAYPNGVPEILAATWDGEGTIDTLAAYLVTAAGAPEGFVMTAGDHIGLVEDGRYGLFTVTETVAAGASTIAVPVEPAVPLTVFTSAATVVFRRPLAEFILLADTWDERSMVDISPISFEAVQKL